jgi:hypothetical protein
MIVNNVSGDLEKKMHSMNSDCVLHNRMCAYRIEPYVDPVKVHLVVVGATVEGLPDVRHIVPLLEIVLVLGQELDDLLVRVLVLGVRTNVDARNVIVAGLIALLSQVPAEVQIKSN